MFNELYNFIEIKETIMISIELIEALVNKFLDGVFVHSLRRFGFFLELFPFVFLFFVFDYFLRSTGTHKYFLPF